MTAIARPTRPLLPVLLALLHLPALHAGTLGESWFEYARIAMSGQEVNANFGTSIAMTGEWAVVGAPFDDNGPQDVGRIEFWQRVPGQGTWVRRDIVYPLGATSTDLFGEDVDIDGDFAVATARGLDWFDAEFAGAAIVLQRSGSSWSVDGQLVDPDGFAEFMGYADDVAIGGDTVAVAYNSATGGGLQRGKVDLFVNGPGWAHVQTIYGTVDGRRIPDDLDIEGDTLVFSDDSANGFLGEVYVYQRSGGTFSLAQTLAPQSPTPGSFGYELALKGDRLAVIAVDWIEIFERVAGTWQHLQSINVPGIRLGTANSNGETLAFSGDRIHAIRDGTGDVLSFLWDGSQYQPEADIVTPSEATNLASALGTRLLVGHPFESSGRGRVDVYQYALNTATSIDVSPSPSVSGSSTTISVTVASDSFTPMGRVFIERDDGGFLCTIAPLLGGSGSCTSPVGLPGDYELVARYDADLGFVDSVSAPFPHTVLPAPTTTTITSDSPDPSPGGTPIVVTYSVAAEEQRGSHPAGDPPPVPTGNVTVGDGVDSCVGTVADGQCTIVLNTPGNRNLVASYEGDSLFAASSSPPEPHAVVIAADLAIDKRQCSGLTRPEATHRFLLRISNNGPSTAESTEVVDELPFDMAFVQASPGCSETAGVVTCTLGDLVAGESVERVIEVLVSADPEPTMINSASVSSLIDDPSLGNNSDVTVTVRLDALLSADGFEFCGESP
ncbi:Ig-like domain repeat protein [Halomonas denitrificans]|nr:DUF11 domain-containing protein [Halomonas denitrificans]